MIVQPIDLKTVAAIVGVCAAAVAVITGVWKAARFIFRPFVVKVSRDVGEEAFKLELKATTAVSQEMPLLKVELERIRLGMEQLQSDVGDVRETTADTAEEVHQIAMAVAELRGMLQVGEGAKPIRLHRAGPITHGHAGGQQP